MEKRRILPTAVQATLQKFHSTLLLGVILLTDCLAYAQVNVEPNTALLNEGDRTELLCRYERPITYCRMEIAGEKKVYNLSPDWDKTPGFTYHGSGLQAGQCGVTIERVKAINNGQVKCTLGVEGEEVSGTINLVVALRPKQPIIELITKPDREGYFHEGSNFEARCIVRDGRPAANITWMLDNEVADKRVGQLEVLASPQEYGLELSTTIQAIQWRIAAEDNGRKLICRSHHQTDRENVPPQEAVVPLYVRYAPIHLPETVVYGLYLDHTVKVNLTIRANPLPIVEWNIDGHLIRQGEQNGRFSAFEPEYLGQDYYNVTLVIAGLSLEDTNRIYHLRATNSLGSTDYNVRLSSSATPPAAGLEMGAIVGIVVAVAFLILIVLLVLFARATGRWCFAGKSVKMSPNETKANQQHGQNVALLETPNGATLLNRTNEKQNGTNDVQIRYKKTNENDEDDSFEYGTDRESSVYNSTTMPLRTTTKATIAVAGSGAGAGAGASNNDPQTDLLNKGNQLGIPESRFSRWIPKDQREILEKQAKLLAQRIKPKILDPESMGNGTTPTTATRKVPPFTKTAATPPPSTTVTATSMNSHGSIADERRPTETEIYSDTESADVKATASTTTTLTTATMLMASEVSTPPPPPLSSSSSPTNMNNDGNNDNNGHQNNNNSNNNSISKGRKKVMKAATSAVTSITNATATATAATKRLPATLTTLLKRINSDHRDQQPLSKCKDATELGEGNSTAMSASSNVNGSTVDNTTAAATAASTVSTATVSATPTATSIASNDNETVRNNNSNNIASGVNATVTVSQPQQQQQNQLSDNIDARSKAVESNDNNQPKEDKQLVYAELVLKPSDNNEAPSLPPKSSTEYAEIVYVQKSN